MDIEIVGPNPIMGEGDMIEIGEDGVYLGSMVWFDATTPGCVVIRCVTEKKQPPSGTPLYTVEQGSEPESIRLVHMAKSSQLGGNSMNKTEFREAARSLLEAQVQDLSLDDKLAIVRQCLVELQKSAGFDEGNKNKPWTDNELRLVLQHTPTKEACILLARAFRRGYGSIEQIFRWAASTDDEVSTKRPDDAFVQQIKRIAKEIGWRAT